MWEPAGRLDYRRGVGKEVCDVVRDELTVHIDVPDNAVDPGMLERFARAIRELTATSGKAWAFTSLAVGSLDTAARPITSSTQETERALAGLAAGLMELESGRMPRGWDHVALTAVAQLDGLGGTTIGVGSFLQQRPIRRIADGANRLLNVEKASIGSVEGRIDSVSLTGSPRCGVVDAVSGRVIQVGFARHFESQVLDLFHQRVRVQARGRLFRDAMGEKRKLTLRSIRALEDTTRLSVHDVVGALGDLPEGIDSVEWIRRQRD